MSVRMLGNVRLIYQSPAQAVVIHFGEKCSTNLMSA